MIKKKCPSITTGLNNPQANMILPHVTLQLPFCGKASKIWKLVQLLSHCIFKVEISTIIITLYFLSHQNENLQKSEFTTPQSMGQDQCLGTLMNN